MAYSGEIVRRAQQRLALAKADRESENHAHLAQAYAQVPRLQEIDQALRQTMVLAAQAVFARGGDAAAAMEQAKQANLALQREREALVAAHFEEGFLDETPICLKCGGTGYVGSAMCECLKELCRQEQKRELTLLAGRESFDQFRLDYYPDRLDPETQVNMRALMERSFRICRRYADSFSEKSGNLLFSGRPGLGKTFLSACIARVVADNGYSVAYESAQHLFAKLERAHFGGSEEAKQEAEALKTCDLLILDDLGTEMPSAFVQAALYGLINDRLMAGKPMILSTNLSTGEMEKRYTMQTASRLRGSFQRVTFVGDDIRLKRSREG